MDNIYEFSNGANWDLLWNRSYTARRVSSSRLYRYYPIEDFTMPFLITAKVVAVVITSDTNPGKWRKGGYCKQKIQTNALAGGSYDSYLTQSYLQLDKVNIVRLQEISSPFAIEFHVPFWLRQVTVTVFEYTGIVGSTIDEKLTNLQTFIRDCCQELQDLSVNSSDEINSKLAQTITKLTTSEAILNSIDGITQNIDDRLESIEVDGIVSEARESFSPEQARELNEIVTQIVSQTNNRIDTLSNNLDNALGDEIDLEFNRGTINEISLEEEFLE